MRVQALKIEKSHERCGGMPALPRGIKAAAHRLENADFGRHGHAGLGPRAVALLLPAMSWRDKNLGNMMLHASLHDGSDMCEVWPHYLAPHQ